MERVHVTGAHDMVWEDPPSEEEARPLSKWEAIAAQLQSKPHQWAIVATSPPGTGGAAIIRSNIVNGRNRGMAINDFEARVVKGGAYGDRVNYDKVYARYVGEWSGSVMDAGHPYNESQA